jgi:hypothetical protein
MRFTTPVSAELFLTKFYNGAAVLLGYTYKSASPGPRSMIM